MLEISNFGVKKLYAFFTIKMNTNEHKINGY